MLENGSDAFRHYSSRHRLLCPRLREGYCKGAPLTRCACHRDVSPMSSGDGPGGAEAQAGSGLGTALIASVESFENAGKILRGDADPRVFHCQRRVFPILSRNRDVHRSPGCAVLDRIVQEIREHPLDHPGIPPNISQASRTRRARSILSPTGLSTPASVFEIISMVLIISRRRSQSSIALAAMLSYSAIDFPVVRVISAIPRIRVSGLFRSWATLSLICLISVTSVWMRP